LTEACVAARFSHIRQPVDRRVGVVPRAHDVRLIPSLSVLRSDEFVSALESFVRPMSGSPEASQHERGMSRMNGRGTVDTAAIAQTAAAQCVASGLVAGFAACEQAGIGLEEVQQIALIEAMLLQFDGFADHLRALEGVGELLRHLGHE
jgi:hypothetical protein